MTDDQRAWGWYEHLRAGGSTRWWEWTGEPADALGPLPGAQRLEVLRRLNLLGRVPEHLAETVLHTTSLGRGQQERRLLGAGPDEPFGPPRVRPSHLPVGELRRVATGALADLALQAPRPSDPVALRRRLLPRRGPRVLLAGDPLLVASYAAALTARGRPPGGRDPQVLVLVAPLDVALADVWTQRTLHGGRVRWGPWLERYHGSGRLPVAADAAATTRRWASRVGRERVRLCADAGEVSRAALRSGGPLAEPDRLSHAALEALRSTGTLLHLAVPGADLPPLLQRVVRPWVAGEGPGPGVPLELREWLQSQADRVRDRLVAAGYPVHGERGLGGASAVLPLAGAGAEDTDRLGDEAVLEVLLVALHRAARDVVPSPRRGRAAGGREGGGS